MTPDVCAGMDADGIEASPPQDVCVRLDPWPLYWYEADTPFSVIAAFERALDDAPTCAVPSVRWSGWAILTEDGDLDYYAYATDAGAALAIARDAGCEGGIYAIEDGDGAGTCQEVA